MTAFADMDEPKIYSLTELRAIRDRMSPSPRCEMFSNNNGIQSFRLIGADGRTRTWTRANHRIGGEKAGFVEDR